MDWWTLAGTWLEIAEGVPHGELQSRLEGFARSLDLRPISVRKAAAARRFVEGLECGGTIDRPERLAGLPFQRVEVLKRLARYGGEYVHRLAEDVLAGRLKGDALKQEEARIRAAEVAARPDGAAGRASVGNTHAYRLRSRSFKALALSSLPAVYPPPALCAVRLDALASCLAVACDAVVFDGESYVGIRIVAERSGGDARTLMRGALQAGLANARLFDAYLFLCQVQTEADGIAALFGTVPPCGVGVTVLDRRGIPTMVLRPDRNHPADLAPRFYGVFGSLFS